MLEAARVILFAKDMKTMLAFYESVLGLERLFAPDDSEDFVSLDAGGIQISLHKIPQRYAKNIEIVDPPFPREQTPMKVAFRVSDVDEFRKRLESRGVQVRKIQKAGSISFCDGTDPEGNIFQISDRP